MSGYERFGGPLQGVTVGFKRLKVFLERANQTIDFASTYHKATHI